MNSVALGKYLGLTLIFFMCVYIAYKLLHPIETREGFTGSNGVTSLDNHLKELKNQKSVFESKIDLREKGAKGKWQDILYHIEGNTHKATLEQIAKIPAKNGGVPDPDSKEMKNILNLHEYRRGLRELDNYLD
jgi:hypothetical protein